VNSQMSGLHINNKGVMSNIQRKLDDIAQAYRVDSMSDVESEDLSQS